MCHIYRRLQWFLPKSSRHGHGVDRVLSASSPATLVAPRGSAEDCQQALAGSGKTGLSTGPTALTFWLTDLPRILLCRCKNIAFILFFQILFPPGDLQWGLCGEVRIANFLPVPVGLCPWPFTFQEGEREVRAQPHQSILIQRDLLVQLLLHSATEDLPIVFFLYLETERKKKMFFIRMY